MILSKDIITFKSVKLIKMCKKSRSLLLGFECYQLNFIIFRKNGTKTLLKRCFNRFLIKTKGTYFWLYLSYFLSFPPFIDFLLKSQVEIFKFLPFSIINKLICLDVVMMMISLLYKIYQNYLHKK